MSVANITRTPTVSGGFKCTQLFRPWECPWVVTGRVRSKTGSIPLVAHIANDQSMQGITLVHFGLEVTVVNHSRPQSIAYKDNSGILLQLYGNSESPGDEQ